tara:strand:+ start:971 stop:1219 length:249 start_codon:yes stop_codon:yes gene_type:complete
MVEGMKKSHKLYLFIPFTLWTMIIIFCIYKAATEEPKDKNLQCVEQGKMSVVTYKNHSYIVWSINFGGGICHDPDCKCQVKE